MRCRDSNKVYGEVGGAEALLGYRYALVRPLASHLFSNFLLGRRTLAAARYFCTHSGVPQSIQVSCVRLPRPRSFAPCHYQLSAYAA